MIQVNNLSKSFGPEVLFDNQTFTIGAGEKIGLIGRNGHGKTTLFKMLTKEEIPDQGEVVYSKNYRIGYLKQTLSFSEETVIKEGALGLPPDEKDAHYKVEKILFGLGFSKEDLLNNPLGLSGGFQVRLNLAKVLVSECHLLLLDEPTNYLDIISLRWLSRFLRNYPYEVFLITHDREFMDSCVTHIMGIHRQEIKKIKGESKNYFNLIRESEENYEKTRVNEEKKRKETEEFINKFRAKARQANLAQSRMKALEKQDVKEKLKVIEKLEFSFNYEELNSKWPVTIKNLSFGYSQDNLLIKNLSIAIGQGDKIAIIGKNGKGKSTLLNLMAKKMTPIEGDVTHHPQLKIAYFGQTNKEQLDHIKTIEDEIASTDPNLSYTRVRQICGTMLFSGDKAKKKISVLSGGEKSRVILGKILAKKSNTLLLDEPTNHLDMESVEALKTGIKDFDGSAIVVTHNEDMLKDVFNKFIVFQKNRIIFFEGSYDEFLKKIGWEEEINDDNESIEQNEERLSLKEVKNLRREIIKERSKELSPLRDKIENIEKNIFDLEDEKKIKEQLIIDFSIDQQSNSGEIPDLSKRVGEISNQLETLYQDFDEIGSTLEEKESYYDKKLGDLDKLSS